MPKGSGKPIPKVEVKRELPEDGGKQLLETLQTRFEKHMERHKGIGWDKVHKRLNASEDKLLSLYAMEHTGGEPDVIGVDENSGAFIFCDCSEQSPERRSICYDGEGEEMRNKKGVHPGGNAVDLAAAMGVELLDESQYRELQRLGEFDTKTSSWIKTPEKIRKLGGALFGDRRYDTVFMYHNGAESFYGARGFRGRLKV